jgi:ABC-type phosphate/phosphonate transport system substrate-binding protein
MYNVTPGLTRVWESLLVAVVSGLRERGWTDAMDIVPAPNDLMSFWRSPDVLLTQTCGYPFVTTLRDDVRLIATPQFALPGCDGIHYCSVIVVRQADDFQTLEALRGKVVAINQPDSQSGMNALRHTFASLARGGSFFSEIHQSGSHLASLAAVGSGEADIAAIDCVTYAYVMQHVAEKNAGLRVLHVTDSVPGLPLIGSIRLAARQVNDLQLVLAALRDSEPDLMGDLALTGFAVTSPHDYEIIADQEEAARQLGYPLIA